MKNYYIIIILNLTLNSGISQQYFNTVISHSQNFVEGLQHQADVIETDTSIICFPNTLLRSANSAYGSVNILSIDGNFIKRSVFLDSIYSYRVSHFIQEKDAFWMTGYRYVPDSFKYHYWVGKFDLKIDSFWTRTMYAQLNTSRMEKILKISDSMFVLLGYEQSTTSSGGTIETWPILIWIDSIGNIIKRLDINDQKPETWESLYDLILADDGFIYGCGIFSLKSSNNDFLLTKIRKDGSIVWKKSYPKFENSEKLINIFNEPDGTLTAVGFRGPPSISTYPSYYGFLKVKFDRNGNVLSETTTHWEFYHGPSNCVRDQENNFICAGLFVDSTNGNRISDGQIFKVSPSGELLWYRVIDYSPRNELFWMITAARDGGYYLTGNSWYPGDNSGKAWIVKTDQHGCLVPGCENAVSTADPTADDAPFILYPNPASHTIYLLDKLSSSQEMRLRLYDLAGSVVMEQSFTALQGKQHLFDLSPDLPNGLYFLQIVSRNGEVQFSEKLAIQR